MWQLLADLPPQQRAVLVLRYYEDLTNPEIADILGTAYAIKSLPSGRLHSLTVRGLRCVVGGCLPWLLPLPWS